MPFFLRAQKLDFGSGEQPWVVVLQEKEARTLGIILGDLVEIAWGKHKTVAVAYYTRSKVQQGQIGLFREIWRATPVKKNEPVSVRVLSRPPSIEAIRKKLLGGELSYEEMYSVISDIVDHKLSKVEITYFVASSFSKEFTDPELYYMTKAMAETGEMLKHPQKVIADKHSVGGVAGNRTTMVVVPIVASLGVVIPKTSSRAITSPAGTADTMEVLAPVAIPYKKVQKIIKEINCCMIWGGSFKLAPADDYIIRVQHPLGLEPLDKLVVSIMAKKVAAGITHLVVDLPYGRTVKITTKKDAIRVRDRFKYLARRFNIKVRVVLTETKEPVGRGIGPSLEARDVLRVLQQKDYRPADLEKKSIKLAAILLELAGRAKPGQGHMLAVEELSSGKAWEKMKQIIKAQGGNQKIDSEDLTMAAVRHRYHATYSGKIVSIDDQMVDDVARILGAPHEQLAGIYINKRLGQKVRREERLYTLYAQSQDRIELALEALKKKSIFTIRRMKVYEDARG